MTTVIAGDIGATKTRLAIATVQGKCVNIEREVSYPSADYPVFDELVADFLAHQPAACSVVFGVAGPVQGRTVSTTNLPWHIDADQLMQRFGFSACGLLNDLEATAYGLPALAAEDLHTLHAGKREATGNMAVIAAGTGLGEAILFQDGQGHRPSATEGGHTSFSPQNELEFELLRYLQAKYGHVSWERVVSGMGLLDMHDFLRSQRQVEVPAWLHAEMQQGAAAAISKAALSGRDAICVELLEWFVRLYGAEAGNLALKSMSRGGIYIGGGIAPKILPLLQQGGFIEAFFSKGRMRPLLEEMPIHVILNDRAALYGPALRAAQAV